MKKINEMDEQLAKWVINVSIDNGDFKGAAVNIIKITERSYWLGGEAVLGQPGHLPNVHIRFLIGEKAEVQIHKIEFNPERMDWKPVGHWPIYNTSVIIKKLLDEGYSIPPLENDGTGKLVKRLGEVVAEKQEYKEECERLAKVAEFWQNKWNEANPGWQPPKLDNL